MKQQANNTGYTGYVDTHTLTHLGERCVMYGMLCTTTICARHHLPRLPAQVCGRTTSIGEKPINEHQLNASLLPKERAL